MHKPLLPDIWRSQSVRLESTKPLVLIEHVCRIQNNTLYLLHIHAALRQTSTGLALQIPSCSFIWMEITDMNDDWIEVSLHFPYVEHLDNFLLVKCMHCCDVSLRRGLWGFINTSFSYVFTLCTRPAGCKEWPCINLVSAQVLKWFFVSRGLQSQGLFSHFFLFFCWNFFSFYQHLLPHVFLSAHSLCNINTAV